MRSFSWKIIHEVPEKTLLKFFIHKKKYTFLFLNDLFLYLAIDTEMSLIDPWNTKFTLNGEDLSHVLLFG